jgi:ketosteroid isomerase-like protein
MSRENVDVIRAFYEAFNRRDFDQVATYAHPDFEIKPLPALIRHDRRPDQGIRGSEAVLVLVL